MVDAVDAIIVVGPVLWKCVNCDLLFSRRHSTDHHLRVSHGSKADRGLKHRTSLKEKCNITGCCCRTLKKTWKKSKGEKAKGEVSFLNSGNFSQIDVEATAEKTNGICDDSDDDEIPQALRDLVEQASKAKAASSDLVMAVTEESSFSGLNSDTIQCADNNSLHLGVESFMVCNESFHSAKDRENIPECSNEAGILSTPQDNSLSDECMLSSEPHSITQEHKSIESLFPETSISKVEPEANTDQDQNLQTSNSLKRKCEWNTQNGESLAKKKDKHSRGINEKLKDSKKTDKSTSDQGQARRTSGRSNKGKNSLYNENEYKV